MNDLPEPMTPDDCDLRGYDFMPLFGHKLFSSELYTESSDAEFRAAIRLWWSAWNQVPAASLPSSDQALATLADYGRDLKGWAKVKKRALHGFVLCSDGRLYHRVLSPEAVDAYEKRLVSQKRRDADRERLKRWRESRTKRASKPNETPSETPKETEVKRVSKCVDSDSDSDSDNITLTSFVPKPPAPSDQGELMPSEQRAPAAELEILPPEPGAGPQITALFGAVDPRKLLFSQGKEILRRMTGKSDNQTRALIGKWLKTTKDDASIVARAIADAADLQPSDVVAWIEKTIRARTGARQDRIEREWELPSLAEMDAAAEADMREMGL